MLYVTTSQFLYLWCSKQQIEICMKPLHQCFSSNKRPFLQNHLQILSVLMYDVAAKRNTAFLDTDLRLNNVNFGRLLDSFISTVKNYNYRTWFTWRWSHRAGMLRQRFPTGSFEPCFQKREQVALIVLSIRKIVISTFQRYCLWLKWVL